MKKKQNEMGVDWEKELLQLLFWANISNDSDELEGDCLSRQEIYLNTRKAVLIKDDMTYS